MSVQAIAWVLEHSIAEGYDRLVLLAIANHCDARGFNAWPSVDHIAREARVHRSTVFRSLEELARLGELKVIERGRGRSRPNHYELPMKTSPAETLWGPEKVAAGEEKVAGSAIKGRIRATQAVSNRQEPSHARAPAREAEPASNKPGDSSQPKDDLAVRAAKIVPGTT
ncbi:MAG: helix-turn-helix domain-containing protein, partial [Acidimicrobiia bacterium]